MYKESFNSFNARSLKVYLEKESEFNFEHGNYFWGCRCGNPLSDSCLGCQMKLSIEHQEFNGECLADYLGSLYEVLR